MSCDYTLTDLGVEPGYINSSATACSADGSVTVGLLDNPSIIQRAFTHTDGGGYILLSPSGSNDGSVAYDVSEDGSVVVGVSSTIALGPTSNIATYWINNGSPATIPLDPLAFRSRCIEVSADGTVIIGDMRLPVQHVFYYVVPSLTSIDIGDLASGSSPTRNPVLSRDGTTIVGESITSGGDARAFRWTQSSGMADLGTLGGNISRAYDVSDNGGAVIGDSEMPSGFYHAFYWTSGTGMVDITPSLATGFSSYAKCISGDGNIVWGYIQDTLGNNVFYRYVISTNTFTTYEQYTNQIAQIWCCSQDGCVVAGIYTPPGFTSVIAFRYSDAEGFVTIGTLLTGTTSNLYGLNIISEDGKVVVGIANVNTPSLADHAFKHVANCPFEFCSNGGGPSTENEVDPAAARCLTCDICATSNPQTCVYDSSRVTEFKEGRVLRNYVLATRCQARPTPVFASYADYMKYLNASLGH